MQSTVLGVPLSSKEIPSLISFMVPVDVKHHDHLLTKEMCKITENDVWKHLGFSQSVSVYPVLNNVTRSVSSLVYRLLLTTIKTKFCKTVLGAFVKKHFR